MKKQKKEKYIIFKNTILLEMGIIVLKVEKVVLGISIQKNQKKK
uniref:Uncharacterized protein n=1 Tax=Siphoviridae sp. ct0Wl9 TaxID=2827763 RepID=A0A8S5T9I1_9CAUD|nr:MAG TPA: hypothetical protein [Siphoviridae sp. ct0Wl9]